MLVPAGKASGCNQNLAKVRKDQPAMERYVVRFGESIEQIAQARRVSVGKLVELNALAPGEILKGGMTLLVPKTDPNDRSAPDPAKKAEKPVVVVPQDVFVYPDRRRVFYRVQVGDTVRDVCTSFKVTPDELRRWNDIDPSARLVEGMTMQIFAPTSADLSKTVVLGEGDVRTVVAGTDDFFHNWDEKGRRRLVVIAHAGDTLESVGKKHGVTTNLMERINRRGRSEVLAEGAIPQPTPPLGAPPAPGSLPALP